MAAKSQLRLACNPEHALAHIEQMVTVVVPSFRHQAKREAIEQHIAATVEDFFVLTKLVLSVANTIDRHDFKECKYST